MTVGVFCLCVGVYVNVRMRAHTHTHILACDEVLMIVCTCKQKLNPQSVVHSSQASTRSSHVPPASVHLLETNCPHVSVGTSTEVLIDASVFCQRGTFVSFMTFQWLRPSIRCGEHWLDVSVILLRSKHKPTHQQKVTFQRSKWATSTFGGLPVHVVTATPSGARFRKQAG